MKKAVIIFARYPEPGKVKTRIGIKKGHLYAYGLYRAMLADMIEKISFNDQNTDIFYFVDPAVRISDFAEDFSIDTSKLRPQSGNDLGERIASAFKIIFGMGYDKAVCSGSDIPSLTPLHIESAFDALAEFQAVTGTASDGGYYLIGFIKDVLPDDFFSDMLWSNENVYSETVSRYKRYGIRNTSIQNLRDLDELADLDFYINLLEKTPFLSPRLHSYLIVNRPDSEFDKNDQ